MANLSMNDQPSNPLFAGLLSIFFVAFVWTPLASAEESDAPIGWASVSGRGVETTTGGRNGDVVTARTAEELAEYASSPEPLTILIEGTITGDGQIKISSNKTLLGLGASTSLKNIELNMSGVSNIIIRNLHISDARDAIALRRTHHVWVDHCDLSECGDGLLDITHQSDFVTVSWTRFSKHHKTMLINSGTSQPEDSATSTQPFIIAGSMVPTHATREWVMARFTCSTASTPKVTTESDCTRSAWYSPNATTLIK